MKSTITNSLNMGNVEDLIFFRFEMVLSRLASSKACLAQHIRSFFVFLNGTQISRISSNYLS